MKTLFLMRHAEARNKQPGQHDRDRTLTETGLAQCATVRLFMETKKLMPAHILCSDAVRTRQTADALRACAAPAHTLDTVPDFYSLHDGDDMIRLMAQRGDDNADCLLAVGHNPTVHHALARLARADQDIGALAYGFSPATIALFHCPVESWRDLAPGTGLLVDYLSP